MVEILKYICPYCGSEVRVGGTCRGCAKKAGKRRNSKKHSWEQDASHDGTDLPDEDFDYDEFVAREFGKTPHRLIGIQWYWWLLAAALLAGMITGVIWLG